MSDLVDFDDSELYEEKSYRVEEQDLRILKAIVSDDTVAKEFISAYDHNLFFGNARRFALELVSHYKNYLKTPTRRIMLERAASNEELKEEIHFIWDELERVSYNKSEFQWDLDKIKDRYAGFKLHTIKEGIENLSSDNIDFDNELRKIRADLDAAEKVRQGKESVYTQKTLKEYMPEFREDFIRKSKDPELGKGHLTGYSYIDYVTNGLVGSDMLIIGGETGAGKSMFLNNMAVQMWLQGKDIGDPSKMKGCNVQYFSLEMPYDQCVRRTMARLSGISTYGLRDCQIKERKQVDNLAKAAKFIMKFPYSFEVVDIPRGATIRSIEERYLEAVSKGRAPDVVVVDYLGLMEVEGHIGLDDWLKLGTIAGQLHEFARRYDVAVLTAVQLNRPKGKDPSDIIGLHRIGRSSQIMHHATIGIQIETRQDEDTYTDLIYHIIKNRNGERGKHLLRKNFAKATVIDMKSYDPPQDNGIGGFSPVVPAFDDISSILDDLGWN